MVSTVSCCHGFHCQLAHCFHFSLVPLFSPSVSNVQVLHSRQYKDTSGSDRRNVLVVGIGNSGCDIAVELSKYNKVSLKVTVSLKVSVSVREQMASENASFNGSF